MAEKGNFPNLVIAGAPKCGTSSLYFWLAPHPDVSASMVKETFFLADAVSRFNEKLNYKKDGLEAYKKHFQPNGNEKIVFEATAPYIYYQTPLEILPRLNPVPRVAFILREPAKRLYSKYTFSKYKVKNFNGSFEEYISLGGAKLTGQHVEEGVYAKYLKNWVERFGAENIFVMTLENVKDNQVEAMKQFSNWLGIDPDFYDSFDFNKRNETFGVRSKFLHRLGLKLQPFVPYQVQDWLLPFYQRLNGTAIPKISKEEQRLVDELKDYYAIPNRELQMLFPLLNLTKW